MKKILITGGTGLLGKELLKTVREDSQRQSPLQSFKSYHCEEEETRSVEDAKQSAVANKSTNCITAPTRKELDISNQESVSNYFTDKEIDIIIHAAAVTKSHYVNEHPDEAVLTNIAGTAFLSAVCIRKKIRLVYISTDYLYPGTSGNHKEDEALKPANLYSWTKLGGEAAVMLVPNSLIIRTTFSSNPCRYTRAAVDKITSKMYVDELAPEILKLAISDVTGIINVGNKEPQSMFDYAKKTNPDVLPVKLSDINEPIPKDTSLDITKWRQFLSKLNN